MGFYFKVTKDLPKDTILYIPDKVECPECKARPPLQTHCIYCGYVFKVEYLGKHIVHVSDLVSDEIKDYIRKNE
jgi:hypothetical protein